jgi:uncharacterized protein YgiB involved in biofilm formation
MPAFALTVGRRSSGQAQFHCGHTLNAAVFYEPVQGLRTQAHKKSRAACAAAYENAENYLHSDGLRNNSKNKIRNLIW